MHKLKEIATRLDGVHRREEDSRINEYELQGFAIVVAFGASDDCIELRGSVCDEFEAYEGTEIMPLRGGFVNEEGLKEINDVIGDNIGGQINLFEFIPTLKAEWSPDGNDGPAWRITPSCQFAKFNVMEDGEAFCEGAVFYLRDIEEVSA